jgi:HK97 family phage prohead protease
MTDLVRRTSAADLEVRADGRTVVGIAVPFNTPTEIRTPGRAGSFVESFVRGAFARTIAERGSRVKFVGQHDYAAMPLGRAQLLREDAAGLYGEFRVSNTAAGDEALELIRDGALDALSVGFKPITERLTHDGEVQRTEVALYEVSAVAFPAYEGALISAVRSEQPEIEPEPELDPLDQYRQRLAAFAGPTTTMTTLEARRRLLERI